MPFVDSAPEGPVGGPTPCGNDSECKLHMTLMSTVVDIPQCARTGRLASDSLRRDPGATPVRTGNLQGSDLGNAPPATDVAT